MNSNKETWFKLGILLFRESVVFKESPILTRMRFLKERTSHRTGRKTSLQRGHRPRMCGAISRRETAGVAGRLWDSVGASTTPVRAARRCSLRRGPQSSLDAAVDVEKVEGRGKKLGGSAEWPSQSGSIASDLGIAKPAVSNPSLNSKKKIKDGYCRMYNVLL